MNLDMNSFHLHMKSGISKILRDKKRYNPSRVYMGDAKAMAATPADIIENPRSYIYNTTDKNRNNPSRLYMGDAKAMAATPADIIETPNSYIFIVDMPGIKGDEIKVQIENKNMLVVRGERQRDNKENRGVEYVRMERRMGKFKRKFRLSDNVDSEKVSAVCNDGVLKVTVEKLPPPKSKKPKIVQVLVD